MSATSPCVPCGCPTPQVTNVPGVPGGNGTNGVNGVNAFTLTTADFTVPARDGVTTVTVSVADSSWMIVGQILIMTGPGNFIITAIPGPTSVTVLFLGYPGDVSPASAILNGSKVSPSGQRGGSTVYYTSTAADVTANAFMDVIEITGATKTVTLPTAVGIAGKIYTIKLTAASTGTVACTGGQSIDGSATYALSAQYKYVQVVSNNVGWLIIGKN